MRSSIVCHDEDALVQHRERRRSVGVRDVTLQPNETNYSTCQRQFGEHSICPQCSIVVCLCFFNLDPAQNDLL